MMTVKGAIKAFLSACFSTTLLKLKPLRRAVRIHCAGMTSAIEALVMRAI